MALRIGILPQRWNIPHYVRGRNAGSMVSLPHFRATASGPNPKPQFKKGPYTTFPRSRKQADPQSAPARKKTLLETAVRWKSGWQARYAESRSIRLAVWGVVISVSGIAYIFFFVFERVPDTGRRRISWLPRWELTRLEGSEREVMEALQKNEQTLFIKSDCPVPRKIEAVFTRLIEASGLDDLAWEVRVLDEPSRFCALGK